MAVLHKFIGILHMFIG